MNLLSAIYLNESGNHSKYQNSQRGLELLEKAMTHEDGDAYASMAYYYQNALFVNKDDNKALEFYQKSYELKNANGAYNLGYAYVFGIGCPKNIGEGIKIWEDAVTFGSGAAANNLYCFYFGEGYGNNITDYDKAKYYLLKAVELGDAMGCANLSRHYSGGSPLFEQNDYQAFTYGKLAADKGISQMCAMVAYCYENGIGTNKDPQKAQEYRNKANNQ